MIKIYSFPECPYCKDLKEKLVKEGIEFEDINISLSENVEEFKGVTEASKSNEVPIIKIGQQLFIPNVSFQTIDEAVVLTKKFLI